MSTTHWARRGMYLHLRTQQQYAWITHTVSPDHPHELLAVYQALYAPYKIYCRPSIMFTERTRFTMIPGEYAVLELSLPTRVQHTERSVQYTLCLDNKMQYALKM